MFSTLCTNSEWWLLVTAQLSQIAMCSESISAASCLPHAHLASLSFFCSFITTYCTQHHHIYRCPSYPQWPSVTLTSALWRCAAPRRATLWGTTSPPSGTASSPWVRVWFVFFWCVVVVLFCAVIAFAHWNDFCCHGNLKLSSLLKRLSSLFISMTLYLISSFHYRATLYLFITAVEDTAILDASLDIITSRKVLLFPLSTSFSDKVLCTRFWLTMHDKYYSFK